MTEYNWGHLRETAIANWGTVPQGQLEADIIEIFEQQPALVTATITKLTTSFNAGKIHSPWAILRKELQQATSPDRTPTVTDAAERDKTIAKAEQWIRNTGLHYPTENEILNHLFGIDEQTPPLEWLEAHEHKTRGNPGRPLYQGLLLATIERTRAEGPQTIPDSGKGPLAKWKTTAVRDRILELWRELRPLSIQAEADELERAEAWKSQQRAIAAKTKPTAKVAE